MIHMIVVYHVTWFLIWVNLASEYMDVVLALIFELYDKRQASTNDNLDRFRPGISEIKKVDFQVKVNFMINQLNYLF